MDSSAILNSSGRIVLLWAIIVVSAALVGDQSGVICMTPVAWLLALFVGRDCVRWSKSEQRRTRLLEAAIAGALFGLVEGVVFPVLVALVAWREEILWMAGFALVMGLVGAVVCAAIAAAFGALVERRGRAAS